MYDRVAMEIVQQLINAYLVNIFGLNFDFFTLSLTDFYHLVALTLTLNLESCCCCVQEEKSELFHTTLWLNYVSINCLALVGLQPVQMQKCHV